MKSDRIPDARRNVETAAAEVGLGRSPPDRVRGLPDGDCLAAAISVARGADRVPRATARAGEGINDGTPATSRQVCRTSAIGSPPRAQLRQFQRFFLMLIAKRSRPPHTGQAPYHSSRPAFLSVVRRAAISNIGTARAASRRLARIGIGGNACCRKRSACANSTLVVPHGKPLVEPPSPAAAGFRFCAMVVHAAEPGRASRAFRRPPG
jgi:hypothetical protein